MSRAFRVDHAVQSWRAERARAAGYTAEVTPYTGYGSTSWVRVLGRVLLAKRSPEQRKDTPTGARGWRNFVSVPVANAEVQRSHRRAIVRDPRGPQWPHRRDR